MRFWDRGYAGSAFSSLRETMCSTTSSCFVGPIPFQIRHLSPPPKKKLLQSVKPYRRLLTLCSCADFQTSRERGLSLRSPSSPACTPDPGPGAGAVPSDRLRSLLLSRRLPQHARHRRQGAAEAGGARPRTGDHRTAAGTGTEGGCGPAEVLRR